MGDSAWCAAGHTEVTDTAVNAAGTGSLGQMTRAARRASGAVALTLALALRRGGVSATRRRLPTSRGRPPRRPRARPTSRPCETGRDLRRADRSAAAGPSATARREADRRRRRRLVRGGVRRRGLPAHATSPTRCPASPRGAQALAKRDRALMSNQDIGDRIDGVERRSSRVVARRPRRPGARRRRDRPRRARVPDRPATSSAPSGSRGGST